MANTTGFCQMIKMLMAMDNPPFVDDLPFENDLQYIFMLVALLSRGYQQLTPKKGLPSVQIDHHTARDMFSRTSLREEPGVTFAK